MKNIYEGILECPVGAIIFDEDFYVAIIIKMIKSCFFFTQNCFHPYQKGPSDAPDHRVGRVLSFFSSRRNWDFPNPSPAGECAPPPRFWGEGHTRWRERGWESPNSDEGMYTVVLFIFMYFVRLTIFLRMGRNQKPFSLKRLKNQMLKILHRWWRRRSTIEKNICL